MRKGLILILIVMVLLLQLVGASTNAVSFNVDSSSDVVMRLTLMRYDPAPVAPGEYFDLWIALEPTEKTGSSSIVGLNDIQDVELELVEDYPFSIDPNDDVLREFGNLGMGEQVIAKYRVRLDETSASGDNEIKFIYRSADDSGIETPSLDINVQDIDPTLNILSIETIPEQLIPGSPAELSITISNGATSVFKNIDMKLDIDGTSIPLVPYKSSRIQTLRTLGAGEDYTFTFDIIAEEDAAAGVYKIPFNISYSSSNNSVFSQDDTFGILIGAEADLSFNLEEFDTFQKGTTGAFVVSVSNVGPSELKFMTIELLEGDGYVNLGTSQEYLGNLDSDDFETSSFDLYVENENDVELSFQLNYKDTYNEEYEETFNLTLPVYSNAEVSKYGLDGNGSSILMPLVYLVIILFLYFGFKGWRKHNKFDLAAKYGLISLLKLPFRVIFFFKPERFRKGWKKVQIFFKEL